MATRSKARPGRWFKRSIRKGKGLDKSGADGFRDDVLLMREVLEDWCALSGVRPDSPAAVKAASILLGLGQGWDLHRQQLLQALLEMAPANRR